MRVLVYLPLLLSLVIGPLSRPVAERLAPRQATWLLTIVAVALTGLGGAALALLAADRLLLVPTAARLGHYAPRALRPYDPTDGAVGVIAGLLLIVAVGSACRAAVRRVRALRAASRFGVSLPGTDTVVVIGDARPEAFAVPSTPGRIVVSTGMLDALAPREHEALLAHERSHLARRHHRFLAVVAVVAAANPFLRSVARSVAYTVERWADEDAAAATGDRPVTAAAVGRAALASSRRDGASRIAAGLLGIGGRRPGPVPRRVAALLTPTPPRASGHPLTVTAAVAAILLVASVCALRAAADLHNSVELAQQVTMLARHHHHQRLL